MRLFLILIFTLTSFFSFSQKITTEQYIAKYKDIAIREMLASGIPASITLAQGILESQNGNSRLAVKANNHFGIKCHSSWTGKKIYKDDDKKHECFRHYKTAEQSFIDHTNFIKNGRRYQFLFEYKTTNYKAWAKGLKKAGYATNPKYPQLLISLIERYNLSQYDKIVKKTNKDNNLIADNKKTDKKKKHHKHKKNKKDKKRKGQHLGDVDNFTFNPFGREIKTTNRVDYIIAKQGDTFFKLAKEFDMMTWEIHKYNDLPKTATLKAGQRIYLKPKRNKAERGNETYIVKQGDTMYSISQKFAVKLKKLYRKNNMKLDEKISTGQKIWLRKRKPQNM